MLEALALLAALRSREEQALTLAGAASRIRDILGAPLPEREQSELDREMEKARGALTHGAREPYQCGRCMGLNEAIAYAITSARE